MKHVTKYENWTPINESATILAMQIGVIIGLVGWPVLKDLIKKAAIKIGAHLEQEPAKLKKVVDEIMDEINTKNQSGVKVGQVGKDIKAKIDAGEIKTIAQITKYFGS